MFNNMLMGAAGESIKVTSFSVDNSMVLNDDDAQYLQRSNPGTPTSANIGTVSVWFKRGNFPSGNNLRIWNHGDGGNPNIELLILGASDKLLVNGDAAGGTSNTTTMLFRDPHAWYNAVVRIDTTQSTAADRVRLYINGTLITDYDSTSYPDQNGDIFQSSPDWWIGRWSSSTGHDWDGYISEVVYCDGQSLAPTAFGETDDNGVWRPIDVSSNDLFTVSSTAEAIANSASATNSSGLTTYTYSGVALGTASSTRAVYVFATGQGPASSNFDVSSMTVGGVSATRVADVTNSAEAQYVSELWRADVPSGTTGDIVVVWNSAMSQCGVIAWAVTGDHSLFDIQTTSDSTASFTLTDIPDGSVILAGRGGTGSRTHTWSSDVTENVDEVIGSGVVQSGASSAKSTGGDFTVTCTPSSNDTRARTVCIVLGPTQGAGTNGFYLPFTASGALGADYATTRTAPSIAFVTSNSSTTNTTSSYTFSSQSLGAAASDRKIFVCASMSAHTVATLAFGTVTIGGVTATQLIASNTDPTDNLHPMAIFVADVPSGTTGDIVLNVGSGSSANCGIAIYRATACGEMFDSGATVGAGSSSKSVTVQTPKGGFVLLHGNSNNEDTRVTLTNVTEDYDFAVEPDAGGNLGIFGGLNTSAASSDPTGLTTTAAIGSGSYFGQISISVAPIGDTSLKAVNSPTQTTDSPTTNAATFSPLITRHQTNFTQVLSDWTFTNGNRTITHTSGSSGDIMAAASQLLQPGQKYHFEAVTESMHSSQYARFALALVPQSMYETDASPLTGTNDQFEISLIKSGGTGSNTAAFDDGSLTAPTNKPTTNSRLTFEVDMSTIGSTTVRYYFNGSLDTTYSSLGFADEPYYVVSFTGTETDRNGVFNFNFGSSAFTDTPTSGHTGLTAKDAFAGSAPAIEDGSAHFQTTLYTGNGSTQTITQSGFNSTFQPDLIWEKQRDGIQEHTIFDAVRGTTKYLQPDNSGAEGTQSGVTAFNSNGFDLGSWAVLNENTKSHVAWQWLAGNATSTPSGGDIATTVSVNQTNGLSIAKWTGNGNDGDTIAHGLGATPSWIIYRKTAAQQWFVQHAGMTGGIANGGSTKQLTLDGTDAEGGPFSGGYIDTIGSSTMTLQRGSSSIVNCNDSSAEYIGWFWCEKPGFSKFGSFEGNGNSNGPFIELGFKPAWIMVKGIDANSRPWVIHDSARNPHNVTDLNLLADATTAEASSNLWDFLSNGFKVRDSLAGDNENNKTYIYMAFAEHPFAGTTPITAR